MTTPSGILPSREELAIRRVTNRRNFWLNITEGALYTSSSGFISAQTVLPALVARMGGNNVEVGAVGMINWIGLFLPQIFAARIVETIPWKKPYAVRFGTIQRFMILLIGVVVLLFGSSIPSLAVGVFLFLFLLNQLMMGITTPGWFDMFAKMTPADRRGRLVGIRNSIGGVGSFVAGICLTFLLGALAFPFNFSLAFLLAFLLQISSIVVQNRLIEREPSMVRERKPVFSFLRQLPGVFRSNADFRRFVMTCMVLTVALTPAGFFAVYGLKRFAADESVVGEFTLLMVVVQVVSGLVTGALADRHGNKVAIMIAAASMLCASVLALLAPSMFWFRFVFLFVGVNVGTDMMARYNMVIDYGPPEQRSTYVGLMNTVIAPFYLAAIAAGWLIDISGYEPVFLIGAGASVLGLFLLWKVVRDPRPAPAVS